MRNFLKEIREKILVYDGSKGTMFHKLGLKGGECPELWNVTHPEEVKKVYRSYKEAGSDVIQTNTFQGSRTKLEEYSLGDRTYELNFESVRLAKEVMGKDGFVAASIGPLGILFEPSGELTFDHAYEVYKEQVKAVTDAGADIINFETFTDLAEMRAALLAAKETTDVPVICSVAFESNGRTLMGTDPYTVAVVLKALGADMIGVNCSLGPEHMIDIVKKMSEVGGIYISVKPNAGLPELVNGEAVFKETPGNFSALTEEFVRNGARLIGGCCGTTPDFIKAIREKVNKLGVPKLAGKSELVITSGSKALNVGQTGKLNIGEINAAADETLLSELSNGNLDYIIDKSIDLSCEGYEAVYFNVDKVKGGERLLADVVNTAQGYMKEPFILETENPKALDRALRLFKGKAGVVIDGYSEEKMEELLVAAKKYGSTIISKSMM